MISPDSPFKKTWDNFIVLLSTVKVMETALRGTFGYEPSGWALVADWLSYSFFIIDIFLRFFTAEIVKGRWLTDRRRITRTYLRGWFILDLLGSLPLHDVTRTFLPDSWFSIAVEWLCLVRLARVWQFTSAISNKQSPSFIYRRFAVFLFWIGLVVHLIACGWIVVGGIELKPNDNVTNYITALYWTITTVSTTGYGDITAKTTPQMIYALLTMIVGAGLYAVLVANIASILTRVDSTRAAFQDKLERLTTFMRYKKLPLPLQQKILSYHSYLWETGKGQNEHTLLDDLPDSLRQAVLLFLNHEIFEHVPFFQNADEAVLHELVTQMKSVVVTPGDFVFRTGEPGKAMYFINRGRVEVVSADEKTVYATLKEGDYFGEIALLNGSPRTACVRAVDFCSLYVLERETFAMVLQEFPNFATAVRAKAQERRVN